MIEMKDRRLLNIVYEIKEKYSCHTIILYGSRARGDSTETSDYDIIAIRETGELMRDGHLFEGAYLDVFIYSEQEIKNPDASLIRIKDGVVIVQKNNLGDQLLKKIKNIFSEGPKKIADSEKQVIRVWSEKMLNRASVGDIEGNFRRHWLLFDVLEGYFNLRDQWYLGPKESFQWLKQHDHATYLLFNDALKPEANLECVRRLVERIITVPK